MPFMKDSFMMVLNTEKAFRSLIMETHIKDPMSKISSKDKASISGKIQLFIKESLSKAQNMDPDYSFLQMAKPLKKITITIRKST